MQADDHYTHIHYSANSHFMISYGLGEVEERIKAFPKAKTFLIRLGRKYIINTRQIFRISTMKGLVYLLDTEGNTISLQVSKPVLRSLMELMQA